MSVNNSDHNKRKIRFRALVRNRMLCRKIMLSFFETFERKDKFEMATLMFNFTHRFHVVVMCSWKNRIKRLCIK